MSEHQPINNLPTTLNNLPVLALAEDIATALSSTNVLLRAEPGAGKSTGLPLALLLNADLNGKIILLEPRRLAARSVAQRLASHLGEKVGQRVGLRMRSDTRISNQTQLEVVTEGVLTRLLQQDPTLEQTALVIFDEFHERSLHADLGLALCLEVQRELRRDLRLLLMSATLDMDNIRTQLSSFKEFQCSVRQHPVETVWFGESKDPLQQSVVRCVLHALEEHSGDVLVFLPGVAEINRTGSLLRSRLDENITLHYLHSGVSSDAQQLATAPATEACRRVILSTSLAETSITIDGVSVVIDSGLERRGRTDSSTGAQLLETVMASQASATQRAGRAGRTSAGYCYRLWNESGHARRSVHWQPEILRADLAPLLVELDLWGASNDCEPPWLEPPPKAALSRADDLLSRLGIRAQGHLTAHGRIVSQLPVHPRFGHMLVWAAQRGVAQKACQLSAFLEEQQRGLASVDLEPALRELPVVLRRRSDQLMRSLTESLKANDADLAANERTKSLEDIPSLAVVLAQAFPDWIAQRRTGDSGKFQLACGAGVVIDSEDSLAHSQWLAVAQLGGAGKQARIFKAMALDIDELKRFSPEHFTSTQNLDWDDRQERVLAERCVVVGQLVVDKRPIIDISESDKASALIAGIRRQGLPCLPWTAESREWQARVSRMRALHSNEAIEGLENNKNRNIDSKTASKLTSSSISKWPGEEFPNVNDESLIDRLEDWLLPWLQGIGSMKALQKLDLYKVLNAMLSYQQKTLLDDYLPTHYKVPSGSRIRLRYTQPGNPVLSVRLQEMLGCSENPTLATGRIPLKIELLSPARRPVQVTEDLANFWTNSYPAVKKDMAGRYPKHDWPDDPLKAQPTAYAKRKK
ncbi:MAG: ATP-dependent helicase HrpB [Granulosicoccus sp.]|nr:ATP-dependent helicase HrpB [Granulosicoccus sp.]